MPFWSLSIDWRSNIVPRLKAVTQSLAEYDTSAKIDIQCKTSCSDIHSGVSLVDALLAHIGSQVSRTVRRSAYQEYADHIIDESNYNEPDFDQYSDDDFLDFSEVEGTVDGHHAVPFDYHCVVGSFEVEYTCAWRVNEEYYQNCDEWLCVAGPLAELDWSYFDFDWK